MLQIHSFNSYGEVCEALAVTWLDAVNSAPSDSVAGFALAGGTTPAPLFRRFAELLATTGTPANVPIRLTATDERWVADSDPQSNEGMIATYMAQANRSARRWDLISLKTADATPAAALDAVAASLAVNFPGPFSAVMLGMGADGHIASLFPDAPHNLVADSATACIAATHPQSGQARISLSMSRLLDTERIWLLITGDEKRRVLENARIGYDQASPIGTLLREARCAVDVFWCPDSK